MERMGAFVVVAAPSRRKNVRPYMAEKKTGKGQKKKSPVVSVIEGIGSFGEKVGIVGLGRRARVGVENTFTKWEGFKGRSDLSGAQKAKSAGAVIGRGLGSGTWALWTKLLSPIAKKVLGAGTDAGLASVVFGAVFAVVLLPGVISFTPPNLPLPQLGGGSADGQPRGPTIPTSKVVGLVLNSFGKRRNLVASASVEGNVLTLKMEKQYRALDEKNRRALALGAFESVKEQRVATVLFIAKDNGEVLAKADELTVVYANELKLKEVGDTLRSNLTEQKELTAKQREISDQKRQEIKGLKAATVVALKEQEAVLSEAVAKTAQVQIELESLIASASAIPDQGVLLARRVAAERSKEEAAEKIYSLTSELTASVSNTAAVGQEMEEIMNQIEKLKGEIVELENTYADKEQAILTAAEASAAEAAAKEAADIDFQIATLSSSITQLEDQLEVAISERDSQLKEVQDAYEAEAASLQEQLYNDLADI